VKTIGAEIGSNQTMKDERAAEKQTEARRKPGYPVDFTAQ
jgi:hypothetical protein